MICPYRLCSQTLWEVCFILTTAQKQRLTVLGCYHSLHHFVLCLNWNIYCGQPRGLKDVDLPVISTLLLSHSPAVENHFQQWLRGRMSKCVLCPDFLSYVPMSCCGLLNCVVCTKFNWWFIFIFVRLMSLLAKITSSCLSEDKWSAFCIHWHLSILTMPLSGDLHEQGHHAFERLKVKLNVK